MRKFLYLLLVPMISLGLSAARAADPSNVLINFVHPENFTDFRILDYNENASVPIFRREVASYLSPVVAKRFPGETLTLTFTDIDLAGLLNRKGLNNTRFNREFGPKPIRLSFNYAVADSKGSVVAGGSKTLVSQDYLRDYVWYPESLKRSSIFYEKATLLKWVRGLEPSSSKVARE